MLKVLEGGNNPDLVGILPSPTFEIRVLRFLDLAEDRESLAECENDLADIELMNAKRFARFKRQFIGIPSHIRNIRDCYEHFFCNDNSIPSLR